MSSGNTEARRVFIPEDFDVPSGHAWPGGRLVPLSLSLAAEDHAAVRASAERIRHVFGPANGWPPASLSEAENTADILRHEAEFVSRQGFAYGLLCPDSGAYLGCFYIKRIKSREETDHRKTFFGAQAFFWLDEQAHAEGRDAGIYSHLSVWLDTDWPFACVAWPGRNVSWHDWQAAERDASVARSVARQVRDGGAGAVTC